MNEADLNRRFDFHAPSDRRTETHIAVRAEIKRLAVAFAEMLPEGREKSLAITKLEEAQMWAHAAIARDTEGDQK